MQQLENRLRVSCQLVAVMQSKVVMDTIVAFLHQQRVKHAQLHRRVNNMLHTKYDDLLWKQNTAEK